MRTFLIVFFVVVFFSVAAISLYHDTLYATLTQRLTTYLAQAVQCEIESLESIRGGIIRGLTITNVVLKHRDTRLVCPEVVTDLSLLDFLRFKKQYQLAVYSAGLYIKKGSVKVGEFSLDVTAARKRLFGLNPTAVRFWVTECWQKKASYRGFLVIEKNQASGIQGTGTLFFGKAMAIKPVSCTLTMVKNYLVIDILRGNFFKNDKKISIRGGMVVNTDSYAHITFNNIVLDSMVYCDGYLNCRDKTIGINITGAPFKMGAYLELMEALGVWSKTAAVAKKVEHIPFSFGGDLNRLVGGYHVKLTGEFGEKQFNITAHFKDTKNYTFILNFNDNYAVEGVVNDDDVTIQCDIVKGDITDIMLLGSESLKAYNPRGSIAGNIKIYGKKTEVETEGELDIVNLQLKDRLFEYGNIQLNGIGSILTIENSILYYKNNVLSVGGFVDLKSDNMFRNIILRPKQGDTFFWEGIEFSHSDVTKTYNVKKDLNENISIKLEQEEYSSTSNGDTSSEIKLEYKIDSDKDLIMRFDDRSNMVGVKRSVSF